MKSLTGTFAQTVMRKAIEEKLPEWIGTIAELAIRWIEGCAPGDVEQVCAEMPPHRARQFRMMVLAVKGPHP